MKLEFKELRGDPELLAEVKRLRAENAELLGLFAPALELAPDPLSAISAVIAEFERHYQPELDDDPSATADCLAEARGLVMGIRAALKRIEEK